MIHRLAYLVVVLLFFSLGSIAQNEKRLALIIGNSEYYKGNYLQNPVNDAEDVGCKLKLLGFDEIIATNTSFPEINNAVDEFTEKAANYDVALFYYAGHGIQAKGENYMVPIDAEISSEVDVRYKCFPLGLLLEKLEESGCPMKIVVLDACRNNPFARSWYRGNKTQGLASVNPPKGTYITFSTAAGSVALDGMGRNSPYTEAFLATLETPMLSLFDFFNNVGQKVLDKTNNQQDPWSNHNTMKGGFCFNMGKLRKPYVLATKMAKDTRLIPNWAEQASEDKFVGVSLPMADSENARKNAIVNATLQYLINRGHAKVNVIGSNILQNISINQDEKMNSDFYDTTNYMNTVDMEYTSFDVEVINEYLNHNNEYFVQCRFSDNKKTDNTLKYRQSILAKDNNVELKFSITSMIEGKKSLINLTLCGSDNNPSTTIVVDGDSIIPSCCLQYDDTYLNTKKMKGLHFCDIGKYKNLAIAQLAVLAQLPIVPAIMEVTSVEGLYEFNVIDNYYSIIRVQANSISNPQRFSFTDISENKLGITITDSFDDIIIHNDKNSDMVQRLNDVANQLQKRENAVYSVINDEDNGFILLSKTFSMLFTINELCKNKNSAVKGETSSQHSIMSFETKGYCQNIMPFFTLDNRYFKDNDLNNKMTLVYANSYDVKVGDK